MEGRLRYEARVQAVTEGGTLATRVDLVIREAKHGHPVYSRNQFHQLPRCERDPHQRVDAWLQGVQGKSYEQIRAQAIADHRSYFNRVSLQPFAAHIFPAHE